MYEKSGEENEHSTISLSVGEWVRELNRGLLEKAERIRSISEAHPPLAGEDADYIKFCLGERSTSRLFFKHARLPQWISWLEEHGFTKPLFDPHAVSTYFDQALACWLTDHFFVEQSSELMATIQRNATRIHPRLAFCIWRRLFRDHKSLGDRFSRWVVVLLTQPRQVLQYDQWCSLLCQCHFPEDKIGSLLLFDLVTKPSILLKEPWHIFDEDGRGEKIEFDLNLSNEVGYGSLSAAWSRLYSPNLSAYANELVPIVTANLAAAHGLLQICGRRGARDYDPFQIHRQSIEHPDEHGFKHTIDVLLNAAKAIINHFLLVKPQQAIALITVWLESDAAILRRLAVYGYGRRTDVAADDKLHWIVENRFLYLFKTDVFEFLKRCYQSASDEAKRNLITRVLEGPKQHLFDHPDTRTRNYEIYNFTVWLTRIAPACSITREVFERLQREHADFGPRDYPELDYKIGSVHSIQPTEGFDLDSIASRPAADFLDKLRAWKPRHPMDRSRADFCDVVSGIAGKRVQWGLDWIHTLVARDLLDADLWQCVCQGWRNANLTPEQWASVINGAETIKAPRDFFSAFAEVLETGSRKEHYRLPDELMGPAQRVAEQIWDLALKDTPLELINKPDWLSIAINRPGGKLAEFWLQRISVARKMARDSWQAVPAAIATSLITILHSFAGEAAHARTVFASQLHYFYYLDSIFAKRELLPLFDWKGDPLRAEQCWNGYLWWGRWLPGLTELLLPQFDETLTRLEQFPRDLRRHAISHVAALVLFLFDNPITSGWLTKTLLKFSQDHLDHFAAEIDRLLDDTDPTVAEKTWDRWLKDYWEMRLLGTPKPLSRREATEMVHWSLSLGQRLPDAVKLVHRMLGMVEFEHPDLLYRINRKGTAKSQPQAAAELTLFFFKANPRHFYPSDHIQEVWNDLNAGGVSKEILVKIREAMLALDHDPEQSKA